MMPATNGTAKTVVDWAAKAGLDDRQRRAFVTIMSRFLLTFYVEDEGNDENELSRRALLEFRGEKNRLQRLIELGERGGHDSQMIMLLHGPGGSGKSAVIELVTQYARGFCEMLDCPFTSNTIAITAMSGVAATLLGGQTLHTKCCLCKHTLTAEDMEQFRHTRLLIVDEVSFASWEELRDLHRVLRELLKKDDVFRKFGGVHIVFAGDFRQLEPVKKDSLCKTTSQHFEWVNSHIELDGMHRFKDDKAWGKLLRRFRDGLVTKEDIDKTNKECMVSETHQIPPGIQCASYSNRNRDIVNTATFEKHCLSNLDENGVAIDAVMTFSDGLVRKTGEKTWDAVTARRWFYENVGESDIDPGKFKPRVDPVLKLFRDCPMMLTHNMDVLEKKANGTCCTLERIGVRPGEEPFLVKLDNGAKVRCHFAGQIDKLRLRHACGGVDPPVFDVFCDTHSVTAKWPVPSHLRVSNKTDDLVRMKLNQFPVVSNTCTTGHKLQGKTVDAIFAWEWNYTTNWPHVVLSRVKTMDGVCLRTKLDCDLQKCEVPQDLTDMIARFKQFEPEHLDLAACEQILEEGQIAMFHNSSSRTRTTAS